MSADVWGREREREREEEEEEEEEEECSGGNNNGGSRVECHFSYTKGAGSGVHASGIGDCLGAG
jgi:hypothetical protein